MHRENIFDLFNQQQQAEAAKAAQTADVVTPAQVRNEDDIVRPEPDKQEPAPQPEPNKQDPAPQPADNSAENEGKGENTNV